MDPSLQIDVLTELELEESTTGVRQVPGLHNGTKAFLFQGMKSVPSPQCWFSSDNPGWSWPHHLPNFCIASWMTVSELRCDEVNVKYTHLPSLVK